MISFMSCDEEYFSIYHINIRRLKANLQNFESYLQLLSIKFSVIEMTDTWLDDTSCLLYSMPKYNFVESHRKNKSGGGVAIFLRDGMLYKQRTDLSVFNDCCEYCFIEIEKKHKKNNNSILTWNKCSSTGVLQTTKYWYPPKQKLLTILIQFSCNSHAIIDEIFRNAPAILTYNSHPILTRRFSSNSHLQFSSNSHLQFSSNSHLTILIQFSPDNSHPIFTWQFSSNSHLQFSLNSHQHCSVNSHQQCSANFLVMISQSVLISHAAIFIQCWFYNGSE